jgi:hypothetical protein
MIITISVISIIIISFGYLHQIIYQNVTHRCFPFVNRLATKFVFGDACCNVIS